MYTILFSHFLLAMECAHWLRHSIYAPWTFLVFVFIGVAQVLIGWESGELAVKALTKDLLSDSLRKRYLRLVRVLASLLLPATVFIGLVNDRGQRDADDKATRIRSDQQITQFKLDEANARARHYDESFAAFAKSLDPSKLTLAQYTKLIEVQRDIAHLPTPITTDIKGPFSQTSNKELRDAVYEMVRRIHSANLQMYDVLDEITRLKLGMDNAAYPSTYSLQAAKQNLGVKQEELRNRMNFIVQSDVPLANLYLTELLRRLGPQKEQIALFSAETGVPSINVFAGRVMFLDDLADRLPNLGN